MFTRLMFYGTALLHRSEEEVLLMPIGYLMDLLECYKQFNGMARPYREMFIDDVIPEGI